MTIDQNLVKLFFTVAEALAPIALGKIKELIEEKTTFGKAINIVDSLLRSNIVAAESTIKAKILSIAEDGVISEEEKVELKDIILENVKKMLTDSVKQALGQKVEVNKYLATRYDEISDEVANEKESMITPEGYLNIAAVLPEI